MESKAQDGTCQDRVIWLERLLLEVESVAFAYLSMDLVDLYRSPSTHGR